MVRLPTFWLTCILFVAQAYSAFSFGAEPAFQEQIRPIFTAKCVKCHNGEESSAHIRFDDLTDESTASRRRRLWRKAVAQIESGSMPPRDAPPLNVDEKERLLTWMKDRIENVDRDDRASRDPGPTVVRRLTLPEYNRTIRDLLGFEFDAAIAVGMTHEVSDGNPFGNLGAALEMPPALLEKYFAAADSIVDRYFGSELSSSIDGRIQEQARASRESLFGLKPNEWRNPDHQPAPLAGLEPRDSARVLISDLARRAYRGQDSPEDLDRLMAIYDRAIVQNLSYRDAVRVVLKALLVSPKFLFRIEGQTNEPSTNGAAESNESEFDIQPVTDWELASRLSFFLWSSSPDDELFELARRGRLSATGPSIEMVKLAGKVIGAPGSEKQQGNNRDLVFDGDLLTFLDGPDADSFWIGLDLGSPKPIEQLKFACRAGHEHRMIGGRFQASNKVDFSDDVVELLHVTQAPASRNAWNIATGQRPSGWNVQDLPQSVIRQYVRYLPPKNSFGNIAEFEVRGPAAGTVIEQQVRRMLADPRARAITDNFAVYWLQLYKLPSARPSTEFFPEFNANVRQAMFDETALFFDSLRRDDGCLLNLLQADYTFVNEELAKYYGLPDVTGKEMRRIALPPELQRSGLLGMGSILAVTSHTSRTSPTLRGKWILEVLLGAPPPPPPANVSQIQEGQNNSKSEIKTFREKLTQHAQDNACAGCHRKMDPLGFSLDNFDAVGRWRDKIGDRPLDVSGELPGGEKLAGIQDLRRVLIDRKQQFVQSLTEQMLVYALGRELEDSDDCVVRKICTQLQSDNYRFSTLILEVANSDPFRLRRATRSTKETAE